MDFDIDDGPRLKVTAFLVVRRGGELLDRTATAIFQGKRRPDRLVLVDATQERLAHDWVDAHPDLIDLVPDTAVAAVSTSASFADAVDAAVDALPEPGEQVVVTKRRRTRADKRTSRARDKHEWFWLLHEDSAPHPDALDRLMSTVGHSSRIGIAGCKVRRAGTRRLVDVGYEVTRTGRHIADRVRGELDQGQYDDRADSLAVDSSGMLIRRDVFALLGGFDPAFDGDGDGLDLCWRAHLAGHQVVVVPEAVVEQEGDDEQDVDTLRPQSPALLRRHRQVALARSSLLGWPVMSLWVTFSGFLMAVLMLVIKRPRRALSELVQATAPFGLIRIIGARARFVGRSSTRRRFLEPLFVSSEAVRASARDAVASSLSLESRAAQQDVVDRGVGETGPVDSDAVSMATTSRRHRVLVNPGLWSVVLLLVLAGVQWRRLLGAQSFQGRAGELTGGSLRPFATDSGGVWQLFHDRWSGPGVGGFGAGAEYLAVLWPFTRLVEWLPGLDESRAAGTTVGWLLALTLPLSGLIAYRAGRVFTHRTWPRAAVAVLWATTATATTASAQGRLGPAVAHAVAPFAFAGVVAVAARKASATMTFATCLAAGVLGAFSPLMLVFVTFGALCVVVFGSGWARLRGAVVAVLPWLLLGAQTRAILREPRLLFAGPGTLTDSTATEVEPWKLLLLHPGGSGSTPVWFGLPLLVLALVALLLPHRPKLLLGSLSMGLIGLGAAVLAPRTEVFGEGLSPWAGVPLDVFALACAGIALSGFAAARRGRRSVRAVRHPALVACVGVVAVVVGAMSAWIAVVDRIRPAQDTLPKIVAGQLTGPRAVRVLVLDTDSDSITHRLVGRETGLPAADPTRPQPSGLLVGRVVTQLAGGTDSADTERRLHDLAVGYVLVRGDGAAAEGLERSLANAGGVVRMTAGGADALWRVTPLQVPGGDTSVAASRLVVRDAQDRPVRELAVDGWHARTEVVVPAGQAGRTLAVSQPGAWRSGFEVKVDGKVVRASGQTSEPRYALPAERTRVEITPLAAYEKTRWVQAGLLAFVLFGALPFGNRHSRRRAW